MSTANELYVAVLPLMRLPPLTFGPRTRLPGINVISSYGSTVEQYMTLFPDRNFATEFPPDEIDFYVDSVSAYLKSVTGGHVIGYDVSKEATPDGRVIVKVVQHVA